MIINNIIRLIRQCNTSKGIRNSSSFIFKEVEGDDKKRKVCDECDFIDYENPKFVSNLVCSIPPPSDCEKDREYLILKRGIQPAKGRWCWAGGFIEKGEDLLMGGKREGREECGVEVWKLNE